MPKIQISLASFDENDPKAKVNSPRSLTACKLEGVLPEELTFKTPESFHERGLSPRLVKLRYDFFEAKRRDLLAAAKRARDTILADERRESGEQQSQLATMSAQTGFSKGAILALNGDTLAYERKKLLKAQATERKWLENALGMEIKQLAKLESGAATLEEAGNKDAERVAEQSRKQKELNDKRAQDEERKQLEAEARSKLEKQIAKEEFAKQGEEQKIKAQADAVKQQEFYEKQKAAAVAKLKAEEEKEAKRQAAYAEQEARKNELRAQDLRRMEVMEQQKQVFGEAMREKQEARDLRIFNSVQANLEIEQKRRDDFEEKQALEAIRDEKRAQEDAVRQEESAKKSFQLMMRRQIIADEAAKRAEDRRLAITEQQEETEMRLLDHEQKKERYLDFKRELDGLRGKNKEINVERQRRKEEAKREHVADEVKKKDDKMEAINSERQRLQQLRRAGQTEAYRAREQVKNEIVRQRIKSNFNSKKLTKQVSALVMQDIFHPKIISASSSLPSIKPQAVAA